MAVFWAFGMLSSTTARMCASLVQNFKNAVDEYLAFCEHEGKVPDKPCKGSFNVRIGTELHKKAALYAAESDKKLNNVVEEALEEFFLARA